ncbi:very-long-chain 3-oxoacyl-CoA reductase [Trichomonascus vanleenenianus]|uniref:ketoreductase n=1 Tax=Trichomonascus vanleenenianus TaxID=2268995 RepID=UPI003EC96785
MPGCIVEFVNEATELAQQHKCAGVAFAVLASIGLFKLTNIVLSYFAVVFDLWVLPPVSMKKYGGRSGAWAVITGASDGIGKEFAYQLAFKGFNVGLVSRTESKLQALAQEIEQKYKVQAKYLAFDVSTDDPKNYEAFEEFVTELGSVTVLINNVGQSHSIPTPFLETTEKEMRDIITINNVATLKFTQIATPKIIEAVNTKKIAKRGLVLTMGSFSGLTPTPLLATYSGSKAFLQAWNNAVARELAPHKVDCQLVLSYLVTSAMSKVRRTSMLIPNPKQFVKSTLRNVGRRVGAQERYATITPYWSHALFHWAIETFVGVWSKITVNINYSMHVDIRKRALRKAAREAEKAAKQK